MKTFNVTIAQTERREYLLQVVASTPEEAAMFASEVGKNLNNFEIISIEEDPFEGHEMTQDTLQ